MKEIKLWNTTFELDDDDDIISATPLTERFWTAWKRDKRQMKNHGWIVDQASDGFYAYCDRKQAIAYFKRGYEYDVIAKLEALSLSDSPTETEKDDKQVLLESEGAILPHDFKTSRVRDDEIANMSGQEYADWQLHQEFAEADGENY